MNSSLNDLKKILIVRADRMGDVILSTPSFEYLKESVPNAEIYFWIQPQYHCILKSKMNNNRFVWMNPKDSLWVWASALRKFQFDAVIHLQSQRKIAWATRLAGIPFRVGPLSKPHSFFCYNQGLRQKRSQVEKHEAEYNIDLVQRLLGVPPLKSYQTNLSITESSRKSAAEFLGHAKFDKGEFGLIHPGMGGSALNWPLDKYKKLVSELVKKEMPVLVTLGPQDDSIRDIFDRLGAIVCPSHELGNLGVLAALIEASKWVVAPSTGPLHLAVALSKPVVTFFPEIRVQSVHRWGPFRPSSETFALSVKASISEVIHALKSLENHGKLAKRPPLETSL